MSEHASYPERVRYRPITEEQAADYFEGIPITDKVTQPMSEASQLTKEKVTPIMMRNDECLSYGSQLTEKPASKYIEMRFNHIPESQFQFAADMVKVLNKMGETLLEKNLAYGDSALNPSRVFSDLPAEEGILIRMDDKLNRIKNLGTKDKEDSYWDLYGYMTLFFMSRNKQSPE